MVTSPEYQDATSGTPRRPGYRQAFSPVRSGESEARSWPHHLHTATSLNNLAYLLRDQGVPAAARPLLERALAIRERVLGPDHPDTVATRRALAELAGEGDGAVTGG